MLQPFPTNNEQRFHHKRKNVVFKAGAIPDARKTSDGSRRACGNEAKVIKESFDPSLGGNQSNTNVHSETAYAIRYKAKSLQIRAAPGCETYFSLHVQARVVLSAFSHA